MASTTAGAFKQLIESGGLSLMAYRDEAGSGATLPYVTVAEGLALNPALDGDTGDASADHAAYELVQVDLWQRWRNDDKTIAESPTLASALVRRLRGAQLPASPTRAYGVRVDSVVRLVEKDTNLVHHAISCTVLRLL